MMRKDIPRSGDRDFDEALDTIVDKIAINYRGALILTHPKKGYKWKDWYPTLEGAQKAIDDAFVDFSTSLQISMKIEKEGKEIELGKEHTNQFLVGRSPYESYKNGE